MLNNFVPLKSEQYDIEDCFDVSKIKEAPDYGLFHGGYNHRSCLRPALVSVPAIDFSSITDFKWTFSGCKALTSVPQLDTSKGTDFSYMFSSCTTLTTVPQLDTSNGSNFGSMFDYCTGLTSIPQLDTSKGTDFSYMFYRCDTLTSVPKLDTSNGTNFRDMFYGCSGLTTIPQLDTSAGKAVSHMFHGCKIENVDSFSAPLADYAQGVFYECKNLKTVGTVDLRNASDVSELFLDCEALTSVGSIRLGKATAVWYMFHGCKRLTQIPPIDVKSATQCMWMFDYCEHLTTLGTENVPDADGNLVAPWQFKVSVDFGDCPLDKTSIECVMNNIQTVTTTQTLTISKTSALNIRGQTDKSYDYTSDAHYQEMMKICTDKGWTVAVNSSY